MKFSCEAHSLQRGISVVQNVAQSKIANPIVENVLITATEGQVFFTGTNLTQSIQCVVEASVEQEGQIAVPGRYMNSLARELEGGTVNIQLKRNRLQIYSGKSEYRLGGIPAEEFPPFLPLSEGQTVLFTTAELKDIIRKTVFCTSSEKARFDLDGVKVSGEGNTINLVSTDGRRLSILKLHREAEIEGSVSALVPTRTWQELGRILPEGQTVQVTFGKGKIMFESADVTLLSSLLGDNFPPYEQIVPKEFLEQLIVSRAAFETAVRRASVLASESTNQVILEISGNEMVVRGESQELGEAKDVIEVEYGGKETKVSYKGDYILDFLKSVPAEKIVIRMNDAVSPAGYQEANEESYLHVIMPMKIQEEQLDEVKETEA